MVFCKKMPIRLWAPDIFELIERKGMKEGRKWKRNVAKICKKHQLICIVVIHPWSFVLKWTCDRYLPIIFLGFEVLGGGNTAFGFFVLEQLVELDVHHQHVGGLQVLLLSLHLHDHSVHIVHLSVAHWGLHSSEILELAVLSLEEWAWFLASLFESLLETSWEHH